MDLQYDDLRVLMSLLARQMVEIIDVTQRLDAAQQQLALASAAASQVVAPEILPEGHGESLSES